MDIAFDNKEISLKLKRHDEQNGHHVKNETIYIALVLVKDRMVQTNCLLYKISKLSIALEKSPVKNTKKEIRKIEYNENEMKKKILLKI